ncbi:hypothetical protein OH76DRAFT_1483059 [Lentinus brumalis]|uniref:Uncharacterized protein n=1 Tax=Lentinus brumalis TaxID=2498619 RepID=A0A371DA33_9APHY|nr:hypothetical protein OH76DRAFT_1483059 [Polyporus brumalis]
MSIATLPSSPSLKWLPGPPSTETATSLPPLQPSPECSTYICDGPLLETHVSQACIVEYEPASYFDGTTEHDTHGTAKHYDSYDADDHEDSWSSGHDDDDEIPLGILVAQHSELAHSSMPSSPSLTFLASTTSTSTASVYTCYGDDDEPDFDMITTWSSPPDPSAANQWRSTFRASGDATACLARDAHSILGWRASEDSTCISPADPLDCKVDTVHSSDTPSLSTSTPDDHAAHVALQVHLASPGVSTPSDGSRSRMSRTHPSYGSQSSQSSPPSVASSSLTDIVYADAAPVRRGWLEKLKSWYSRLGAKCLLHWTRARGPGGGG